MNPSHPVITFLRSRKSGDLLLLRKRHAPGFYLDASTRPFGFLGSVPRGNESHYPQIMGEERNGNSSCDEDEDSGGR